MNFEKAKRILTCITREYYSDIYDVVGFENRKLLDNGTILIKFLGKDLLILNEEESRYDGGSFYTLIRFTRNKKDIVKELQDFMNGREDRRSVITKNSICNDTLIKNLKENIKKLEGLLNGLRIKECDIKKNIDIETDIGRKDYLRDKKYNIGIEESNIFREIKKYRDFLMFLEN